MSAKIIVLLTAVCWSTAGLFVKALPWSAFTIACFRGGISFAVLAVTAGIRKKQGLRGFLPHIGKGSLIMALFAFAASALYMCSIKLTSAANAIVLQYIAPVLVLLYTLLIEKKKPFRADILCTAAVFGGIVLAFSGQISGDGILGNCLALLSGVLYAGQIISSRKNGCDPSDGLLISCALSFFCFLPFALSEPAGSYTPAALAAGIAMGLFQYGLANLLYSVGIRKLDALNASLILTIEPVLNPIWVFIFLGEVPSFLSVAGLIVVVGALILQTVLEKKRTGR